jgi:hypothetical protein
MADQRKNGMIINAPGARAAPSAGTGAGTRKLVMKPLKRESPHP